MVNLHPDIEIIHFNDGLIASVSLLHSGYTHIKRVVTVHGLDVVFPLWIYQRLVVPKFNSFDHIIAVSQATARALRERKIHPEKISVINNGIDHGLNGETTDDQWTNFKSKYSLPNETKVLLMLGRAVKRKGFSWFISQVLPLLSPNIFVVIAGPFAQKPTKTDRQLRLLPRWLANLYMLFMGYPSDQQDLRTLLRSPGMRQRAVHLGKLPIEDLKILLSSASIFLMPNIHVTGDMEGFGLVCLEASIAGSTVLASDIEGIADAIIDKKNGHLVPSADPGAWKRKIEDILQDDNTGFHDRTQFRKYTIENYSWLKMTAQYASVFETLLIKNKLPSRNENILEAENP